MFNMSDAQSPEMPTETAAQIRRSPRVSGGNASGSTASSDDTSPTSRGGASSAKRSKKPTQSAGLAQAKLNAKKRSQGSSPQIDVPILIPRDHLQPARDSKEMKRHATGVVYNMKMIEHRSLWDSTHPERPERFTSILQRCEELDLLNRCTFIVPRDATLDELKLQHTEQHIERLQEICRSHAGNEAKLEEFASHYDAIYFHPTTYELSLSSCGSTIELVQDILKGNIQNGMAIVRPPGHHAMKEEYCGYCFFNNVAIAAKKALESGQAQRILIVDYDVHHGQATQQMFYDDPRVLYFSTHRYEHGMYWPNLEESNYNWTGTGRGEGYNCNIPLNKTGMGNTEFLNVWHQILLPLAYKFNPDLVIVSAGYDAALGCPEGRMQVQPQCYPHLIAPLMGLASGKIAVILEGGYCLKSLAEGAALTLRTLIGDPCPVIPPTSDPMPEIVETILNSSCALMDNLNLKAMNLAPENDPSVHIFSSNTHKPVVRYEWNEPKPLTYPTRDCNPVPTPEEIEISDLELDRLILVTDLTKSTHKVGLVYDDIMLKHRNITDPGHPERPERISNIYACHVDFDLVQRCHRVVARQATEEELRLIHTEEHILRMRNTPRLGSKDLRTLQERYNSIFFNNNTNESALYAAGSLLQLLDAVMNKECQSGVAIVRPPGHHAETDEACGFCIYNNVSLAAKYALEYHNLKRILILDWDVHHGNGIQRMFEDDPRVLYISIHRYDHGVFFPASSDANFSRVGKDKGAGFNINIPWNGGGMGDTEYLAAFMNIVLPVAYEYSPELVLVSAGFDAARGDPLGGCKVTPEMYGLMTHLLMPLANGKVILALEGGYNLTSIAYSMTLCTKALLGDPLPPLTLNEQVNPSALQSIRNTLNAHAQYWTVIKPFRKLLPLTPVIPKGQYGMSKDISVSELMARMDLNENEERSSRRPDESDVNVNIPEPPPACGEPTPAALRTQLSPRQPVILSANSGSGENVSNVPVPEPELEGAVGGSTHVHTIQEAYRMMFSQAPDEEFDGNEAMYLVAPLSWCPHVEYVNPVPGGKLDTGEVCQECESPAENWICLTCYSVHCSRYVMKHMEAHSQDTDHKLALSFADLSVWCYGCDAYLDCEVLKEAKSAAHLSKFGHSLPSSS